MAPDATDVKDRCQLVMPDCQVEGATSNMRATPLLHHHQSHPLSPPLAQTRSRPASTVQRRPTSYDPDCTAKARSLAPRPHKQSTRVSSPCLAQVPGQRLSEAWPIRAPFGIGIPTLHTIPVASDLLKQHAKFLEPIAWDHH